jgi:GNAT superfamily N-acetyltransferase
MAEVSTYDFDWTPPGWDALDRRDLFAWYWPAPNASSRGVARASFDDADLLARVGELREFFERHARTARWHLDSTNRSPALAALLHERAGAVHEPRNMTAELERLSFRGNPDVRVEEVRTAELARSWIERCFPELTPAQIADEIERWSAHHAAPTRRGGDLAAFIGDELVGSASWRDSSEGDCVQFVGGWTLPSVRGRGVYSTLCAYRVARALERGLRYACIVADPTTSGPIVARAGFADHGPHYIFTDVRL